MNDIFKAREFLEKLVFSQKELEQYRKLGTPEELRALKEKQIPKEPVLDGIYFCPKCKRVLTLGIIRTKYCKKCGQAICWNTET